MAHDFRVRMGHKGTMESGYATNTYVNPVWSAEFSLASSIYLRGGIWLAFLNLSKTNANFARIAWY